MASIKFLGASGTVTGSSYVLYGEDGRGVMIDLGSFQGPDDIASLNYSPLEFDGRKLDGVLLTHAHLDHCGRLPLLLRTGFSGKIYMTEPTRLLIELTLKDSAHIAADNKEETPLFDEEDVEKILSRAEVIKYHEEFELNSFGISYKDAGHILGSASLLIKDFSHKDNKKYIFSGDLGNSPEELVKPTELIHEGDVVVMESTYGDRAHPTEDSSRILTEEINAIDKSGGTLLIPAFSVERTQELIHKINHLKKQQLVKEDIPVFLDSPMAIRTTGIYKNFKELYSAELYTHAKTEDPFDFPGLFMSESRQDSKAIKEVRGPKVIIAGSGMMNGGRIVYHAADYLSDPNSRLLIVGFQGEGTLGRQILDGERNVIIRSRQVSIRANVRTSMSMSAHADQPRLVNWLSSIKGAQKVFLTHGEDGPRKALKSVITDKLGIENISMPHMNELHEI